LGTSLKKTVVAEGIETEEQMRLVRDQGCHEGQGYLFGKAIPADAILTQFKRPMTVVQMVA
jgi:EAL domain-containing protein (putative c-di-GMP-specific phosphodiesterase class I)